MAYTKFPYGVSSYGIPLIGSGPILTTGNVFFVHAGTGSSSYSGTDPSRPFDLVETAVAASTAASTTHAGQDTIIMLPYHAEAPDAATDILDLDKDGLQVIGLGYGPGRPTFTMSDADNPWDTGADGLVLANVLFIAGVDSLAAHMDIDDTTGLLLEAVEFRDASNKGVVDTVDLADETDITIRNCRWYETDAGIGQSAILGTTPTRLVIQDSRFYKDAQTGIIELGNATDLFINNVWMETIAPEDLGLVLGATATGWVDKFWARLAQDAANITEAITANTDIQVGIDVYIVNADAEAPCMATDTRGQNTFALSTDA